MDSQGFGGLRVLSLESRRAPEMAKLITNHGGHPMVAPSMREVPLESNTGALEFADLLMDGRLDIVIFLTGVGARALARVVETAYPRQKFVEALRRVAVVARGPKPAAALREMEVPISLLVPEPNTWRELLRALDEQEEISDSGRRLQVRNRRVAVQEYGVSNRELLARIGEAWRFSHECSGLPMDSTRRYGPPAGRGQSGRRKRDRRGHVHEFRASESPAAGRGRHRNTGTGCARAGQRGCRLHRPSHIGGDRAARDLCRHHANAPQDGILRQGNCRTKPSIATRQNRKNLTHRTVS